MILAALFAGCLGLPVEAPDLDALPGEEQAQVELGHQLFFDPVLSGDGSVSCATCHQPDHGGAEAAPTSVGVGGAIGRRNAPSVWSASLARPLFWDGREPTLEAQVLGPLLNPDEMGADEDDLLTYLDTTWGDAFARAFPDRDGPDLNTVSIAIAAYERQLLAPGRVDAWAGGDRDALTADEQAGLRLFRANCDFCHSGPGFGGRSLRKLGEEVPWPDDQDLGRFEVTGRDADYLVFRVPSLRHAASTPPYFHDGSVETLEEAIRLMAKHQLGETFSDAEVGQFVSFLRALDGTPAERWRRPPTRGE